MISRFPNRPNNGADRMLVQQRPEAGDIVISCIGRPPLVFGMSVTPDIPTATFGTYDEALAHGRAVAVRAHVDVWVDDGDGVTLVARHRPNTRTDPPDQRRTEVTNAHDEHRWRRHNDEKN